MKVYLLRHGQTDYNVRGLCNDDPAGAVQHNSDGVRQAMAAERLKTVTISKIFVSELPRTQCTAAIVNRYHDAEITIEPAINNLRTGFDGRSASNTTGRSPTTRCTPRRLTASRSSSTDNGCWRSSNG